MVHVEQNGISVHPPYSFLLVVTELTSCHSIQYIATLLLVANCFVGVCRNVSVRTRVL